MREKRIKNFSLTSNGAKYLSSLKTNLDLISETSRLILLYRFVSLGSINQNIGKI